MNGAGCYLKFYNKTITLQVLFLKKRVADMRKSGIIAIRCATVFIALGEMAIGTSVPNFWKR